MLGAAFGASSGVLPGVEASVSWKDFDLYIESEYFIDSHDHHQNLFSGWNELGWRPQPKLRFALVRQKTRTIDDGRSAEFGGLIQISPTPALTLGFNMFNPFSDSIYLILSVSVQN